MCTLYSDIIPYTYKKVDVLTARRRKNGLQKSINSEKPFVRLMLSEKNRLELDTCIYFSYKKKITNIRKIDFFSATLHIMRTLLIYLFNNIRCQIILNTLILVPTTEIK